MRFSYKYSSSFRDDTRKEIRIKSGFETSWLSLELAEGFDGVDTSCCSRSSVRINLKSDMVCPSPRLHWMSQETSKVLEGSRETALWSFELLKTGINVSLERRPP